MLSVICFSKDRPLQLQAYLQSLLHYSGVPASAITVLYVDSLEIRYDTLVAQYQAITWRRETSFIEDLREIVSNSESYILFGCDDVFFTDHFDVNVALNHLARCDDLFGFSLRLGLNLHSLPDLNSDGDVLTWDWTAVAPGHWSYPWDVSASIYRRSFVADYLASTPQATNPNRFEAICVKKLEASRDVLQNRLACLTTSKCLTLTVNRVQDEFPNKFDGSAPTDLKTLYDAFLAGRELDWPSFARVANGSIHVDSAYFKLCDHAVPAAPPLLEVSLVPARGRVDIRQMRIKVFLWKHLIKVKETVRTYIPRWLMPVLRNLLRMS